MCSHRSIENSQAALQLEDTSTNGTGIASAAGEWLPVRKGESQTLAFIRNQIILPFCNKGTVEAVSQLYFWQAFVTLSTLSNNVYPIGCESQKGQLFSYTVRIPVSFGFCFFSQVALAIGFLTCGVGVSVHIIFGFLAEGWGCHLCCRIRHLLFTLPVMAFPELTVCK